MGCGCKKDIKTVVDPKTGEQIEKKYSSSLLGRIIVFIMITAVSPLLLFIIIGLFFKFFFISGEFDLVGFNKGLYNLLSKSKNEDDEEVEEVEEFDDAEYEEHNLYVVEKID